MFFSVIIPVYQAERTLRWCLESLLKQDFKDFEAILVDDGSSDKSGEICKLYASKDKRFRYIRKNNKGPSSARNRGVEIAEGEYIVFLDSDDCYCASYLSRFHTLIGSYPDFGHFWCGYTTITNAKMKQESDITENSYGSKLCSYDRKEIMTLHENMVLAPVWNKVFKKSVIQDNQLRMNEELSLGEDLLFNLAYLDCCTNTKIIIWNQPEYEYYYSNESLNHRYRTDLEDISTRIKNDIYYYLNKWKVSEEQFVKYETMVFYMLEKVIWNYEHKNCPMTDTERKEAISNILHSEEFQRALNKGNITIHPLFKFAYRLKNRSLIMFLHNLGKHFFGIESGA